MAPLNWELIWKTNKKVFFMLKHKEKPNTKFKWDNMVLGTQISPRRTVQKGAGGSNNAER